MVLFSSSSRPVSLEYSMLRTRQWFQRMSFIFASLSTKMLMVQQQTKSNFQRAYFSISALLMANIQGIYRQPDLMRQWKQWHMGMDCISRQTFPRRSQAPISSSKLFMTQAFLSNLKAKFLASWYFPLMRKMRQTALQSCISSIFQNSNEMTLSLSQQLFKALSKQQREREQLPYQKKTKPEKAKARQTNVPEPSFFIRECRIAVSASISRQEYTYSYICYPNLNTSVSSSLQFRPLSTMLRYRPPSISRIISQAYYDELIFINLLKAWRAPEA